MEKLYFEIPGIARKEDVIDYIREFHEYQSDTNGAPASWRGAPKNTGRAELLTLGCSKVSFFQCSLLDSLR